jgi:hypothetical protein
MEEKAAEVGGLVIFKYRTSRAGTYLILFGPRGMSLERSPVFKSVEHSRVPHSFKTWYNVEVVGEGRHIQAFVNGEPELDYEDPEPLPAGTVGFGVSVGGTAYVDDIVIEPL